LVRRSGKSDHEILAEIPDYAAFDNFVRMKIEQGQWEKRGERQIFHGNGIFEGILIVSLPNRQLGVIYFGILRGDSRLFFWTDSDSTWTHETDPMAGIVSLPEGVLKAIQGAELPRPGILSPELSSTEVNGEFGRKFGSGYESALDYLRRSTILEKEVGLIRDIRPAGGENKSYNWLEYSGCFSFWVLGDKEKAYVIVRREVDRMSGKIIHPRDVIELERLLLPFDPAPKIK
jgi:hypothetical protein